MKPNQDISTSKKLTLSASVISPKDNPHMKSSTKKNRWSFSTSSSLAMSRQTTLLTMFRPSRESSEILEMGEVELRREYMKSPGTDLFNESGDLPIPMEMAKKVKHRELAENKKFEKNLKRKARNHRISLAMIIVFMIIGLIAVVSFTAFSGPAEEDESGVEVVEIPAVLETPVEFNNLRDICTALQVDGVVSEENSFFGCIDERNSFRCIGAENTAFGCSNGDVCDCSGETLFVEDTCSSSCVAIAKDLSFLDGVDII